MGRYKSLLTEIVLFFFFNIIVFIFKFLGPLGEDFYTEDFYLLEKITSFYLSSLGPVSCIFSQSL